MEFLELVKEAPNFNAMERDMLVMYAYSMFAAGTKTSFENAKLRELVRGLEHCTQGLGCDCCPLYDPSGTDHLRCESLERELGIEVGE